MTDLFKEKLSPALAMPGGQDEGDEDDKSDDTSTGTGTGTTGS